MSEAAATRIADVFRELQEEGMYGHFWMPHTEPPHFPLWYTSNELYAKTSDHEFAEQTDKEMVACEEELRKKKASPRSARCWKGRDRYADKQTVDVLAFLLWLGEMESLLKIARYAPETVKRNWDWYDYCHTWGLKKLMERTVDFYVG